MLHGILKSTIISSAWCIELLFNSHTCSLAWLRNKFISCHIFIISANNLHSMMWLKVPRAFLELSCFTSLSSGAQVNTWNDIHTSRGRFLLERGSNWNQPTQLTRSTALKSPSFCLSHESDVYFLNYCLHRTNPFAVNHLPFKVLKMLFPPRRVSS